MTKTSSFYDTVDQIVSYGVQKEILHLCNEDSHFEGNRITLAGKEVINFGSCSYLGLEFDPRLKQGAKDAIDEFGTQFSESRAYVSLGLYNKLENLLETLFGYPCIVTPTTTLGHISNIPVLVQDDEVVILDHQVHNSVQTAVHLLRARGVPVELIRHNRMDLLEERVRQLRQKYRRIWYMADGIYSMYGDASPVDHIYNLLDTYAELYYYVDDAHGMSIFGENGRGSVLNQRTMHPKMVMGSSLNKAFASGGGVLVYPNREWCRRVRTCGGPLITSGPMQPSGLGAAIASANIHLSPEIKTLQQDLMDRILFTRLMLKKYGLPLISESDASIFFIGVSLPKLGYNLVKRMLNAGYYLNLGIFPAVPMKNTGIRFTITRLHSFTQIEEMIHTLARAFPLALKEEGMNLDQIYKAFKRPTPEEDLLNRSVSSVIQQRLSLKVEMYKSVSELNKNEWNRIFEGKGSFDAGGLDLLEQAFTGNEAPEDNWVFDYIIVRDLQGNIILACFCTTTLWKDDMLSHASISRQVEEERKNNPYYLTSTVLSTGSLLTEGEHLFVDYGSDLWKEALQLFFEKLSYLQEQYKANQILIRDFQSENKALDNFMVDNGFFRISMPDTHKIAVNWTDKEGFYQSLSKWSKVQFKKKIKRNETKFRVDFFRGDCSRSQAEQYYELYRNVHGHGFELNTFPLPKSIFLSLCRHPDWELMVLTLDGEAIRDEPVAVVFSYINSNSYIPMIIGLDYRYNKEYNIYRQSLYQLVVRATELRKKNIELGFSASIEKMKMGARPVAVHAYMNSKDNFNQAVLVQMNKTQDKIY
jgi:7-keto-8-aminopelargonate synthetase-like enzyme